VLESVEVGNLKRLQQTGLKCVQTQILFSGAKVSYKIDGLIFTELNLGTFSAMFNCFVVIQHDFAIATSNIYYLSTF
jgi:hypothetical protein